MRKNHNASRLIDRRLYPRKPLEVKVSAREVSGNSLLYFYTKDLSLGGAFIKSDNFFWEPGTTLELQFRLPHREKIIKVKAEVVYKIEKIMTEKTNFLAGMGVKFLNLNLIDRTVLI